MLTWKEFSENKLNELFENPQPPKNGHWIFDHSNRAEYGYDTDKDPCPKSPCHIVYFIKQHGGVTIGFKPAHSRHEQDERLQFAQYDVGNAVMYATKEYIEKHNPTFIAWSPTRKTRSDRNPEARRKIYAIAIQRALFPQYVPADPQSPDHPSRWVRRDIYEKEFASKGYPSTIDSDKKDTLNKIASNPPDGFGIKYAQYYQ